MNIKKSSKLGGVILIILVLSLFLLPISYEAGRVNKAEAFLHGDYPTWGLFIKETVLDGIATLLATYALEKLARDTVDWINSGFDGNPAYVQNPKSFLTGIGDDAIGEFILGSNFGFVCSPFQLQLKQSLLRLHIPNQRTQCTLSEVVSNVENFVGGDFYDGGWDAWAELVTRSNPYTQFLNKQNELALEISGRQKIELAKIGYGAGFLSYDKCPNEEYACKYNGEWLPGVSETQCQQPPTTIDPVTGFPVPERSPGAWICRAELQTVTPGSVISEQLNKVLGAGTDRLIAADEINEIITALIGQLVSKIFNSGPDGGLGNIETDNIRTEPSGECLDGIDNDADGKIDSADPGCQLGRQNSESADSTDQEDFTDFCTEFGIPFSECVNGPDDGDDGDGGGGNGGGGNGGGNGGGGGGSGSCIFFASNGGDYCDEDENDFNGILTDGGDVTFVLNTGTGGTWFITPFQDMVSVPPLGGWVGNPNCQEYGNFGNNPPFPITMTFSDSDNGQTFTLPASSGGVYTLGVYGGSGAGNEALLCIDGGGGG